MKKLVIFCISVFILLSCFAMVSFASFQSSYDATKWTGPYVVEKSTLKSVEAWDSRTTSTKYTYNSKGYLTKETYGGDESYDNYRTYSYDKNNNLTKIYFDSDYCPNTTYYSYENNNLVKIKSVPEFDSFDSSITKYYYKNGLLNKAVDNSDMNGVEKAYYTYDSGKNLVKEKITSDNSSTTTSYYTNNLLSKRILKYSDGYSFTSVYSYDSNKRLVKKSIKSSDGMSNTIYYSYNSKGFISKIVDNGTQSFTETFTYNSNNKLVKKVRKYLDDSADTYTYSYKKLSDSVCIIDDKIHLEYASTTYNGKAKKPAVHIDGYYQGVDYTVSYSDNVKVGKGKIKIKFINKELSDYSGENKPLDNIVTITFNIKSASSAKKYKTTASLNMRASASSSAKLIVKVPSGATVTYLNKKSGDYSYVSYTNSGKTYKGWVLSNCLKAK